MVQGDLTTSIGRLVFQFVPSRSSTEELLKKMSSKSILPYMITQRLMDQDGRHIATIGSITEDIDGHVIIQMSKNMRIAGIYLRCVIKEIVKHNNLNAHTAIGWVEKSPFFATSRKPMLKRGLQAYFDGDSLLAIHLLVPQIENAIRELARIVGVDTYKLNRQGTFDLRNMDELLRDTILIQKLPQDWLLYLRVLYTDRRGVNLRNKLCHGLMDYRDFDTGLADRILHSVLMLLQLKVSYSDTESSQ